MFFSMSSMFKRPHLHQQLLSLDIKNDPPLKALSMYSALTFVLLLLLGNFPQLVCEIIDDLLLLQLLSG